MKSLAYDSRPKYLAIRQRLLWFLLVSTILPVLTVGVLSYCGYRRAIVDKITQYSLAQLTQTVANVQLKLAEFENISVRLFINKEFNNTLSGYVNAGGAGIATAPKAVEAHFNEYLISNPDIFGFLFCNERDEQRSIAIVKDHQPEFQALLRQFKRQTAYRGILRAGGGIVWSSAIKINRGHFVILGRHIKETGTGVPLGILAIIVDEEKIDRLTNLTIYNRLNIAFDKLDHYSLVINNGGEVVSSPFKEDIGKKVHAIMKDSRPLASIFQPVSDRDYGSEVNQGSFLTEVNHKQTLVTYKTISSQIGVGGRSGWHLLSLSPTSYFYEDVWPIGLSTLLLGLCFAVAAIGVSFYLSWSIGKMM